jgi:TonB family protein
MKICPKCNAQYEYEMSFCLQDGTPLEISGSTAEITEVLENIPMELENIPMESEYFPAQADAIPKTADQTLEFDKKTLGLPDAENAPVTNEKTLALTNQAIEVETGEKTLNLPEQTPAPTEQLIFFETGNAPPITENLPIAPPVEEAKTETLVIPPPPSRTGLMLGAIVGGLILVATTIGGLIYLNPFDKGDEVAIVNPNNSSVNQSPTPANDNSSNSNNSNSDNSNLANGDNSNSALLPNTNSKPTPTVSPIQPNDNKATPTPSEENETPTSTPKTPTPTPTPTPKTPTPTPTPKTPTPTPTPNPNPTPIIGGVVNGKATNLVRPAYPPAAKAAGVSGQVSVNVTIDENGNVVWAKATSGHPLLRPNSEAAARASKFQPTKSNGQPVKVLGIVIYNFAAQ